MFCIILHTQRYESYVVSSTHTRKSQGYCKLLAINASLCSVTSALELSHAFSRGYAWTPADLYWLWTQSCIFAHWKAARSGKCYRPHAAYGCVRLQSKQTYEWNADCNKNPKIDYIIQTTVSIVVFKKLIVFPNLDYLVSKINSWLQTDYCVSRIGYHAHRIDCCWAISTDWLF